MHKEKCVCLICLETISASKNFNLKRHFTTKHVNYSNLSGLSGKKMFICTTNVQQSLSRWIITRRIDDMANDIKSSLKLRASQ